MVGCRTEEEEDDRWRVWKEREGNHERVTMLVMTSRGGW